jgi:hypothetical protein
VTPEPTGPDHLPVYESLIRERGDVVAQARLAAEEMQHQAPRQAAGPGPAAPEDERQ